MEHLIRVADEVQAALEGERPVVALETTLVAHGFPAPIGIEVVRAWIRERLVALGKDAEELPWSA